MARGGSSEPEMARGGGSASGGSASGGGGEFGRCQQKRGRGGSGGNGLRRRLTRKCSGVVRYGCNELGNELSRAEWRRLCSGKHGGRVGRLVCGQGE